MQKLWILSLAAGAAAALPAAAQQAPTPFSAVTTARLQAARLEGEVRLDGRLDEAAWAAADSSSAFTQSYPRPLAAPRQRTVVRVLYGADALYAGVRMYDTHPDSIAAQLARRDASGIYSDWVHVMVDSYHDRRTGFRFSVNPRGVQKDAQQSNDTGEDLNWDAVWEAATRVDSLGWTAEFRIPYSQLRFSGPPPPEGRLWGFQVMRDIARYNERDSWSPWTRDTPGFVSRFGDLGGLHGVRAPTRLEVQPYASSRLLREPVAAGDPFHGASQLRLSVGGDVKAGLPGGLTLSATVNPDFGQVEADPAYVNLTAFETFFPEKRPFFVEGSNIFAFGQVRALNQPYGFEQYFYSRRVGRTPQQGVSDPDAVWVDAPDQTTILGAAKVSGRTGPWTVGVMDALTARASARFQTDAGSRGRAPVEPLTNYLVGRLRRDLRAGQTVVGAMATATHRDVREPAFLSLHRGAYFGGADFEHSWGRRAWTVSGFAAGSLLDGSRESILLSQRSSARYYQRPDAGYLALDSTRTSLGGYTGELAVQRVGRWFGSAAYKVVSPGFEVNDVGFQTRGDYQAVATGLGVRGDRGGAPFRSWSASVATSHAWNFGGDLFQNAYSVAGNAELSNLWTASGSVGYAPRALDDRLTRGGPVAERPAAWNAQLSWGSDTRHLVSAAGSFAAGGSAAGDRSRQVGVTLELRPTASLHVSAGPSFSWNRVAGQYVTSAADALAVDTYGRRYVFASLEQTTASLATRVEWTFSPTLSLQLYAEPFVAAGAYTGYKEFLQPRGYRFGAYGTDRGTLADSAGVLTVDPDAAGPAAPFRFAAPDFNVRSLRGNAVMRWEYRPGSVLFFVWQQQREGFAPDGAFRLAHDAGEIFRGQARNVFMIKATYWISP